MNSVFTLLKELPQFQEEIPLYRVTKYATLSPQIREVAQDFNDRVSRYKEVFSLKGEMTDQGSSVVIRDNAKVLEIYRPSDSFWWRDEELANRETVPEQGNLPGEEDASRIAQDYLTRIGVDTRYTKIASVTRTSVASLSGSKLSPRNADTEIHVNFSFAIDDYPIMGPGAKIRVSMVEDGRISSVVYFWREPQKKEPSIAAINPEQALTWLTRESRFNQLTPDQFQLTVEAMRFGYYAVPPFRFQRFLIPVYEVRGVEESRLLGKRDVTIYTPAIDLSSARIKRMSFVDQLDITRSLVSTK